jgi:hypothetical protein
MKKESMDPLTRMRLEDIFEGMPTSSELANLPPTDGFPAGWNDVVRRAIDRARSAISLPAKIHYRFVWGPGEPRGLAVRRDTDVGRWFIALNVAELRDSVGVAEVVYHECQHLSDFFTNRAATMSRADLEFAAIDFAGRMMGGAE